MKTKNGFDKIDIIRVVPLYWRLEGGPLYYRYANLILYFMPIKSIYLSPHSLVYCAIKEQAGAELGQAQPKQGLDFTSNFCKFGSSTFGFLKLVGGL